MIHLGYYRIVFSQWLKLIYPQVWSFVDGPKSVNICSFSPRYEVKSLLPKNGFAVSVSSRPITSASMLISIPVKKKRNRKIWTNLYQQELLQHDRDLDEHYYHSQNERSKQPRSDDQANKQRKENWSIKVFHKKTNEHLLLGVVMRMVSSENVNMYQHKRLGMRDQRLKLIHGRFTSNKCLEFSPDQMCRLGKLIEDTRPRIYVPRLCSEHKMMLWVSRDSSY